MRATCSVASRVSIAASRLDVEHIFPLAPGDSWSGDGVREWADYSDDEQNSHRALAQTLGNLALLEEPLAERALDASFPEKRAALRAERDRRDAQSWRMSPSWGTAAIAARTAASPRDSCGSGRVRRPSGIDDDDLTPILDAQRRRGWPRGWQREFEYVEYRGEHWEVHDVKYLFNRIFKRLWADSRERRRRLQRAPRRTDLPRAGLERPVGRARRGSNFLYMGWDSKYMLTAVQGVLDEAGLAPEVFVKYSYIGAAM